MRSRWPVLSPGHALAESSARRLGTRPWVADVLLVVVAVAWGSTYLVAKILVTEDTVFAMLAVRMSATALALGALWALLRQRMTRGALRVGFVLGVMLSLVFIFETFGIAMTSATNAGVIISLTIIITPVLESLVGRRRLGALFYIAGVTAVAGVYFLATGSRFTAFGVGDVLILIAAFARSLHVLSMHRLSHARSVDSLALTFVQMLTCGAVFVALSSIWGVSSWSYLTSMGWNLAVWMAYLVIVCTVFPFFIQMWAVRRTSPTRVSLVLGTEPVWAALIGVTIAGDRLGLTGFIGVALVLVGTLWGQRLELRVPRHSIEDVRE
ncbi:DMT family transporter [Microbacterium sp. LMX7-1.2]|uniref:DMT family transporter n=1 Tax=Microbacterium sp. LMX7-1.2 TaxID=3135252 RepID=UPI0034487986